MDQIEYTISLQRILAITGAIGFFSLCLVTVFNSPYDNKNYIWLVLLLIWTVLTAIFSLIGYWWVFAIKKKIISILESNLIVSKAAFASISVVYGITYYSSKNIDIWFALGILFLNVAFFYFIKTYTKDS